MPAWAARTIGGAGGRPRRGRRAHGPIGRWWLRAHRWTALVLGVWFMVQAASGAVLLYGADIARALHPERYTITPSAEPMDPIAALRMVQASHPELAASAVQTYHGVHVVRGGTAAGQDDTAAFVDPGTGRINGIGAELPGFVLLLLNLHECALSCEGMPGHLTWLAAPLPGLFGQDTTLGTWLLGVLGTAVALLAISGMLVWWPGVRALATGLTVHWGRGRYVRDLDLHRVVGIVAVPFLLMWGVTGAAFNFDWPQRAYFAVLPGHPRDHHTRPPPGAGPPLSLEQARDAAVAVVPGAELRGASTVDGTHRFRLTDGYDPYRESTFPGNRLVQVDARGGGVVDSGPAGGPVTERLWHGSVLNGIHFGTVVTPLPRLVWLLFGLAPLALGVTGASVWLTRRNGRNRRRRLAGSR